MALFALRFCGERALPPLPAEPAVSTSEALDVSRELGASAESYRAAIAEDAKKLVVSPPTLKEMSAVFPYSADQSKKVLAPGDQVTTLGLQLVLSVQDLGPVRRQMVLTIRNRTDDYLAYHVVTTPSQGTAACGHKEAVVHDALALPPRGSAMRSECLYHEGWTLKVERVETVALPELGFDYVTRVPPKQLGIERRVAEGHRPAAKQKLCGMVLPIRVVRARERGEIGWRDLIDFYARHSCERYRFPQNYKAFDRPGASRLPAPGSAK